MTAAGEASRSSILFSLGGYPGGEAPMAPKRCTAPLHSPEHVLLRNAIEGVTETAIESASVEGRRRSPSRLSSSTPCCNLVPARTTLFLAVPPTAVTTDTCSGTDASPHAAARGRRRWRGAPALAPIPPQGEGGGRGH
uniref:Uncharacterized protein n=1 Tax=Oryza punctata TaxID=4537 RepID=A0A0E0LBM7_ORYPU